MDYLKMQEEIEAQRRESDIEGVRAEQFAPGQKAARREVLDEMERAEIIKRHKAKPIGAVMLEKSIKQNSKKELGNV